MSGVPSRGSVRRPRPSLVASLALACALSPALSGCVQILGDYTLGGVTCDCSQPNCDAPGCPQSLGWFRTFGDADEQYLGDVAVDASGEVVLAGTVLGSIDFGGGPRTSAGDGDAFVARLDPSGEHLFSLRFGNTLIDHATAVAIDRDGSLVVVGFFSGTVDFGGELLTSAGGLDLFVAKLDPAGQLDWIRGYGDLLDQLAVSVATDSSGHVLVTGCVAGQVDFGAGIELGTGDLDLFVLALDSDGDHLWSTVTGGVGADCGSRIAVGADDAVFVGGAHTGPLDIDGDVLPAAGLTDLFVLNFDPYGKALWGRTYGDLFAQTMGGLAPTSNGGVVFTGIFQGTVTIGESSFTSAEYNDSFVARLDAFGEPVWARQLETTGDQALYDAAVDSAGDVVVVGSAGPDPGALDAYVAKLNGDGDVLWSETWGDDGTQLATSIAFTPNDELVVAGQFGGSLSVLDETHESAGKNDVFVVKLGP